MFELMNVFIDSLQRLLDIIAVVVYGLVITFCLLTYVIGRELWNLKSESKSSTKEPDQKTSGHPSSDRLQALRALLGKQ